MPIPVPIAKTTSLVLLLGSVMWAQNPRGRALGIPVDVREYSDAAEILHDLGVKSMRLITNNPAKFEDLERFGVPMTERVAVLTEPTPENISYLRTKREKMGHLVS